MHTVSRELQDCSYYYRKKRERKEKHDLVKSVCKRIESIIT